ncbi:MULTISPECIES: hypothetical protein [Chromohalobacter]|nr:MULTISPECIES: hypothetical protein [Chromohalobacter]MCI0509751.1 hypothetical protein [Chromohalobacter sp.]MCI0594888.1 hypothetical protein [Chromohalobacter sp.]
MSRLRRLGAETFEEASLMLWAHALGRDAHDNPAGWLLCHSRARRALLWPQSLPQAHQADTTTVSLRLAASLPPSADVVSRLWFWERMAARRHWRVALREVPSRAVALPLWLGYIGARAEGRYRLVVLSGVSGEPLPVLKRAVLWELGQLAAMPA